MSDDTAILASFRLSRPWGTLDHEERSDVLTWMNNTMIFLSQGRVDPAFEFAELGIAQPVDLGPDWKAHA